MLTRQLKNIALLSSTAILMSGCAVAKGLNDSEKEIVADLSTSKFQPASRQIRDNMSTQDNFAQAAFWSHEYNLNPADLEAAIKLSAAVRKMGNPGRAIEITQTTRALYPKDPYLTAEYAAALLASERSEEAISIIDEGLRAAPGYGRLWSLKGAALDQLENYDLARKHYGRALQITPDDPNVMANLGLSYALSGDPSTAETWLRRAAAQPGASNGIRSNLALVMQLQGKPTDTGELAAQKYAVPPQDSLPYQPQNRGQLRGSPQIPQQRSYAQNPGYNPQHVPQANSQYRAPGQTAQTPRQPASSQQRYGQQSPQYAQQQGYMPQQQAQARQPQAARPQNSGYPAQGQTYQPAPTQSSPQLRPAGQPQGFAARSNFTVVGKPDGAPQSAAEAARAAAARSQGQNRRVVVPVGEQPALPPQENILSQIARNVGPKPSPLPAEQIDIRPETLSGRQAGYTLYPTPTQSGGYAQNYGPEQQPTSRERRGAARRR